MPKIEPVVPIGGADELMALLDLLRNATAYEAKVRELTSLRNEINAKVELAGKAEAIPGLYEAAQADRQAASALLRDAKTNALAISAEAIQARDAAIADRVVAESQAVQTRSQIAKEQGEWAEAKALHREEIIRLDGQAKDAFAAAQGAREQAEALREEWQGKVDRLREAGVS